MKTSLAHTFLPHLLPRFCIGFDHVFNVGDSACGSLFSQLDADYVCDRGLSYYIISRRLAVARYPRYARCRCCCCC